MFTMALFARHSTHLVRSFLFGAAGPSETATNSEAKRGWQNIQRCLAHLVMPIPCGADGPAENAQIVSNLLLALLW